MTIEQYLYRLCRNILNERFDWRKYLTTRSYFGRDLCVTQLHVSYGQIGYTIHFLTLVTQCPNSHMIGKWTTSPSMRKIGRNGYHPKKMMRRKNKTPKTKNPRCLHIIIYVRILDFACLPQIDPLPTERRPCDFSSSTSVCSLSFDDADCFMSFASLFSSDTEAATSSLCCSFISKDTSSILCVRMDVAFSHPSRWS